MINEKAPDNQGFFGVSPVEWAPGTDCSFNHHRRSRQDHYPKMMTSTQHLVIPDDTRPQNVGVLTLACDKFIIDLPPHYMIEIESLTCSVTVSPMHCEFMPWLWQIIKEANQILCYQDRITVPPLTAWTDITGNGDDLEERVQTSHGDVWKVGKL